MNRRHIVLATIPALVLFTIFLTIALGGFSSKPIMIIHLRCEKDVSGQLSVATFSENGQPGSKDSFDLKTVCDARTLEFREYQYDESLQFTFEPFEGETVKLTANERNIQLGQHNFHIVLQLMNAPPFIANDSI